MLIRSRVDLCRCVGIKCVARRTGRLENGPGGGERQAELAERSVARSPFLLSLSVSLSLPSHGELLPRIYQHQGKRRKREKIDRARTLADDLMFLLLI